MTFYQSLVMLLLVLDEMTWAVEYTSNSKYKGDKVVTVHFHNEKSHRELVEYVSHHSDEEINIWSEGPGEFQIQVSQNRFKEFQSFSSHSNITMKIVIYDVKDAIDHQFEENKREIANCGDAVFDYHAYNTFESIEEELFRLNTEYEDLVDLQKIGRSFEDRILYIVKISENVKSLRAFDYKPIIWVDAGTHAREWISVAVLMKLLKQVLEGYGKNSTITNLLRFNTLYLIPVFNPDGYVFSWVYDRLWRKTRTHYGGLECRGADPNRNWDVQWGGAGASNNSCDFTYRGLHPESEPCVHAYAEMLRTKQYLLKSYWSLHSYYQILFVPNSYTKVPPADIDDIRPVALRFTEAATKTNNLRYTPFSAANLGSLLTGVALDYVHDKLGVTHSYTVELRPESEESGGFLIPPNQIKPTFEEFYNGFIAALKEIDKINNAKIKEKCKKREKNRKMLEYLLELMT